MINSKKRVLILGGGFGGVKTALQLASHRDYDISLLSDSENFRYYPALYRSATGGRRTASVIPLTQIFKGKPVTLLHDKVTTLDRTTQQVTTEAGARVHYDILVIALGSVTNYFGIEGLPEYSYGIKTIDEAEAFKNHLHKQMLDEHKPDLHYVVVGGGPTGIELAGELPHYIRWIMKHHGIAHRNINIELVEAAPRLLSRMPEDLSDAVARHLQKEGVKLFLGQTVKSETADALIINNRSIRSHTVIWTAGTASSPFLSQGGFTLVHGKVEVDEYLRPKGESEQNIYVIGDNALTEYTGMAQTALYDAIYLADHLHRIAQGKTLKPYKAKKPIYVFPAGHHWSAVLWGKVRLYGWLGWFLRQAADWVGYHDLEPWWMASELTLAEMRGEESCPVCNTKHSTRKEAV